MFPNDLLPAVDEYGVSPAAFKFLMILTASKSIPLSTTNFVKNSAKELVQDILTYLEFRTLQVLKKAGVDTDPDSIQLMHEFNGWKDPFNGIKSNYKINCSVICNAIACLLTVSHIVSKSDGIYAVMDLADAFKQKSKTCSIIFPLRQQSKWLCSKNRALNLSEILC